MGLRSADDEGMGFKSLRLSRSGKHPLKESVVLMELSSY